MASVHRHHVSVPLTVDTSAYTADDLMSDALKVSPADGASDYLIPYGHGPAQVVALAVVDTDDVGAAFDVYFTTLSTSWGTVNDAMDIAGAISAGVTGVISVASGDYEDFISSQVALKTGLAVPVRQVQGAGVYIATVVRGTPTYTNTDALTLEITVELN